MSGITEFFRHCPACGRRFHIKLVGKELVGGKTIDEKLTAREEGMASSTMHGSEMITPLKEGIPVTVDIEDFEYRYKCTHCGHSWSEVHEKETTSRR